MALSVTGQRHFSNNLLENSILLFDFLIAVLYYNMEINILGGCADDSSQGKSKIT